MDDFTVLNRPTALQSLTTRVPTDHGNMFVTITHLENGTPWEVWINIGKAGSCERAFLEALARSIAIGLQHGVPLVNYAEQLRGIRCQPVGNGEGFVHSPADGVALVLKEVMA